MKRNPVQWMGFLIVMTILGGCATTPNINIDNQMAVQQLIEQQKILKLISQYSYCWDSKQPDKLATLFTDNASWKWWPCRSKKSQSLTHDPYSLRIELTYIVPRVRIDSLKERLPRR